MIFLRLTDLEWPGVGGVEHGERETRVTRSHQRRLTHDEVIIRADDIIPIIMIGVTIVDRNNRVEYKMTQKQHENGHSLSLCVHPRSHS